MNIHCMPYAIVPKDTSISRESTLSSRVLGATIMAEYDIEQDVTKKLDSFRKDSHKSENGKIFVFFMLFTSTIEELSDL